MFFLYIKIALFLIIFYFQQFINAKTQSPCCFEWLRKYNYETANLLFKCAILISSRNSINVEGAKAIGEAVKGLDKLTSLNINLEYILLNYFFD